jgi:triosephosphate isomerase
MSSRFLCANWKMNLPAESIRSFVTALGASSTVEVAIAPPFPFIHELREAIAAEGSAALIAAQNCSEQPSGAFTGEVSAAMLKSAGAAFVIVGHSERRALFGEDGALVGRKVARVLAEGLKPIFCVGEDQETRDRGETEALLDSQIVAAFGELAAPPAELIVAYEPVWAIGTGRVATPEIAAGAHRVIRGVIQRIAPKCQVRILYGGSVTPDNAAALAAEEEIEGFLVGGASLDPGRFRGILDALEATAAEKG